MDKVCAGVAVGAKTSEHKILSKIQWTGRTIKRKPFTTLVKPAVDTALVASGNPEGLIATSTANIIIDRYYKARRARKKAMYTTGTGQLALSDAEIVRKKAKWGAKGIGGMAGNITRRLAKLQNRIENVPVRRKQYEAKAKASHYFSAGHARDVGTEEARATYVASIYYAQRTQLKLAADIRELLAVAADVAIHLSNVEAALDQEESFALGCLLNELIDTSSK